MAEHLRGFGVPVPQGRLMAPGEPLPLDFPYPAVIKPMDGCGSLGVHYLMSPDAALPASDTPRRLEEFVPGMAASVALLCGPAGNVALPACRQLLASDGSFAYLGGSLPLPETLTERATQLARRAIESLPAPLGYIGVDLVLGDDPTGRDDAVIEINPRLTTSYVGLRAATAGNLAAAMLAVAEGEPISLSFTGDPIQFDPDGTIHRESSS
jgi:predicted ATP-grasp superfamily ATP-dependent carboligase